MSMNSSAMKMITAPGILYLQTGHIRFFRNGSCRKYAYRSAPVSGNCSGGDADALALEQLAKICDDLVYLEVIYQQYLTEQERF